MVRISPSGPITTPEPLRSRPSVSAERAPSAARTCTPTTAALARVSASITAWAAGGWGVAALASASSDVEKKASQRRGRVRMGGSCGCGECHNQRMHLNQS